MPDRAAFSGPLHFLPSLVYLRSLEKCRLVSFTKFFTFFQRHTLIMESGTKLGHYEIGTPLGKGGMGEVWRARDTKLGREVAIKTLPEEFAKDADRLVAGLRVPALWIKPYSLNQPSGDLREMKHAEEEPER